MAEDILETLVKLLEEQENIEVSYTIRKNFKKEVAKSQLRGER